MLCPFFHLCFTTVQEPRILFFFLQELCSSSSCCRLGDFVKESSASFRTLDHLRHFVLMHFLHLLLLVYFSSFPTTHTIFARFLRLLDGLGSCSKLQVCPLEHCPFETHSFSNDCKNHKIRFCTKPITRRDMILSSLLFQMSSHKLCPCGVTLGLFFFEPGPGCTRRPTV